MVDMEAESMFASIIRSIFASLDSFVYKLLSGVYNVFFNVATADVLKAELMKNLLGRIQIILGVIILFKLVISFFSGVVNPDSVNDQKNGVGSVIKRVVVVLVMLLMIIPLNIPEADTNEETGMGSWNKNMNTHGILFGSLYELQKRVLEENLIFKIINKNSADMSKASMREQIGENFAKDVLKTFFTVNVAYDGADVSDQCEGKDGDYRDTNCVCTRWRKDWGGIGGKTADPDINTAYPIYFDEESTLDELLQKKVVTAYCDIEKTAVTRERDEMSYAALQEDKGSYDREKAITKFNDDTYAFAYSYVWSTIVGVLFCVLILSLTVDVAVRVFKLVVLEIISPIAILSYIDPSSEKTFKNWTKILTETYLAVFIRVMIISLVVFLINNISLTGFNLAISTGFVGFVSKILIYFGLIMFAKEAPKFITQSLGIESKDGGGLFSGVGKLMRGAFGSVAAVTGGVSTARAAYKASQDASEINDPESKHARRNKAKAIFSGLINGTSAVASTGKTYAQAKDHRWRQSMDKVNSANAYRLQNAAEGGTWWGKTKEQLRQDFTGDSNYSQLKREEKALKDRQTLYNRSADLIKKLDSEVDGEVKKKGLQTKMLLGNQEFDTNIKDIAAAWEKGQHTGVYEFGGQVVSAAEFSKAQADAIDYAKNTVYKGEAKFANGAKYTAPTVITDMQASVNGIMQNYKERDTLYNEYLQTHKDKAYDSKKDMVTNIKNMSDFLGSTSFKTEQQNEKLQEKIAIAQANYRGTDGRPGGK